MLAHTWSGVAYDPLRPTVDVIRIEDIAHSLARLPRYLGHTQDTYSVGQHCVIVSHLVRPAAARQALLHDADEAYLGDMIAPLKAQASMAKFRAVAALWSGVIATAFGLPLELDAEVQDIDQRIRINEARDLYPPGRVPAWALEGTPLPLRGKPITPWRAWDTEAQFHRRFEQLQAARAAG